MYHSIMRFFNNQVSSKVHNQLLQIADDRAHAAEQKARQLEREVGLVTYIHGKINNLTHQTQKNEEC